MTLKDLATYRVPTTGVMQSSARMDAVAVLQWAGRFQHTAQEIKDFVAALEQMERTNAGRAFTDAQRADVERAAAIAGAIAKVLKQKGLWDA